MTGLFETHAHLTDERYSEDLSDVLDRAVKSGVSHLIVASADIEESDRAVRLVAETKVEGIELYAMVGVHPHSASEYDDTAESILRDHLSNARERRIVALGEIGLDYHYDLSPRDVQREVFRRQLALAFAMDLPIVLHEREATADTLEILRDFSMRGQLRKVPGVCHCFSGSEESAAILLALGFYLGFDGPITFKNARKAPDVIRMTPVDRLLTETDCPYLTPEPFRGKRNEPSYVSYVVAKMAEFKGIQPEEMARISAENAFRLFFSSGK